MELLRISIIRKLTCMASIVGQPGRELKAAQVGDNPLEQLYQGDHSKPAEVWREAHEGVQGLQESCQDPEAGTWSGGDTGLARPAKRKTGSCSHNRKITDEIKKKIKRKLQRNPWPGTQ